MNTRKLTDAELSAELDGILERLKKHEDERNAAAFARQRALPPFEVLGTFTNKSGHMRVTDPCYSKDTWCAGVEAVLPGTWTAAIKRQDEGDWGIRIKELLVWHESSNQDAIEGSSEESKIDVGVDSGQAGFFDDLLYPDSGDDRDEETGFYDMVCKKTLAEGQAGLLDFGAVSSSGCGDGGYTCYLARNADGAVVGLRIDYLPEQEEENFEDSDEEENAEESPE